MRPLHRFKLSSFQVILLGFAAVILIGAFLLMLPISSKEGVVTPFSDALFTSTSAVCVTGLIVQDTATYWSYFGQAIILILIQIGGLGVVTVAASVSILAGRKIGLGQRSTMQEAMSAPSVGGIVRLTWFTSRSMKNRDTWEFAHRYCGKIWLICGLALIPIVAGIMLCFIGAETKTVGYVGASMLVFPLLLIILSIILTERALKNTFDKSGNPFSENTAIGTILSVKKQWWLKVNTKPIRKHALDGATFPHIVTVKYTVDGNEIVKKKWLKSFVAPPSVNEQVTVVYREDKPTKFRLEL